MADDLEFLLGLGGSTSDTPSASSSVAALVEGAAAVCEPTAVGASDDAFAMDVALGDYGDVLAIASTKPEKRKFERRSWESTKHARTCKSMLGLQRGLVEASARADNALSSLNIVAELDGSVAAAVGAKRPAKVFDEAKAIVAMRLAVSPAVSGSRPIALKQARSAHVVSCGLEALQREFAKNLGALVVGDARSMARGMLPICVFCGQWDETSQKLVAPAAGLLKGEAASKGHKAVQTMMQSGRWTIQRSTAGGLNERLHKHVVKRAFVLDAADGNHLLEGILKRLPFDITNTAEMLQLCSANDVLMLSWCTDRASVNFVVLDWLFKRVEDLPKNIWPHAEPCNAHGIALVKSRASNCKSIAAAATSFAKLMGNWRTANALRDELVRVVGDMVEIRYEARSVASINFETALIGELYGGDDAPFLHRMGSVGISWLMLRALAFPLDADFGGHLFVSRLGGDQTKVANILFLLGEFLGGSPPG